MRNKFLTYSVALVCFVFFSVSPVLAEDKSEEYLVSLYHTAPGKQLDFLKWLAQQDEVGAEVGIASAKIYVHLDGANWDYLVINTIPTDEQSAAYEKAAKKRGIAVGFKQALIFRTMIMNHTDTSVLGPMSAAELVKRATE